MQSSSAFNKISGPIPEVKKSELINDWEHISAYWDESKQSEALANKLGLFQKQLGGLGGGITPEIFCNFSLHLN